jgi:hypothetical protein
MDKNYNIIDCKDGDIVAIYKPDLKYKNVPIFKLNNKLGMFFMKGENQIHYPKDIVYDDSDWIVFIEECENFRQIK